MSETLLLPLPEFELEYEFRSAPITDLQIDTRYQRDEQLGLIELIAKQFDPHAFGIVWVARRDDKSLWIVDGQQRTKGAKERGYVTVPVCIVPSRGFEMEADMFREMNAWRKPVSRADIFRSALVAGVPHVVKINQKVMELGFEIELSRKVKSVRWPKIAAVGALEDMYAVGNIDAVQTTLETIGTCWDGQHDALQTYFLKGVAHFYREYAGSVGLDYLAPRFAKKKAVEIIDAANHEKAAEQRHGRKMAMFQGVYSQLRKLSGKRPPKKEEEETE